MHQTANLVRSLGVNKHLKVPFSNRTGTFNQFLNRFSHTIGQVNTDPECQKDDHRRNQEQDQQIPGGDRALHDLQTSKFLVGVGYLTHFTDQGMGNIVINHHHPDHVTTAIGGMNRYNSPNQVCFPDRVYLGQFLAIESLLNIVGVGAGQIPDRHIRVGLPHQLFTLGGKNLDDPEIIFFLLIGDQPFKPGEVFIIQKLLTLNLIT